MRSKTEPRLTLHITRELAKEAKAQDPAGCTLACAGHAAGLDDVKFSFDMSSGDVVAAWDLLEEKTGRIRHHTAVVEPVKRAMQILVATDIDKKRLMRIIPDEGWYVELANHESRYKQATRPYKQTPQKRTGESPKRKPRRTSSRMTRISAIG
jgi:hypothetical protein